MSDYTVTYNPVAHSFGNSAYMRTEFSLIATAIATKVDKSGSTYTGTHDMTGATVKVAAPTTGSNPATKTYADALAFATALPAQSLGFLISTGTVASFSVTFTGFAVNEVKGADVASASTINLTSATGNLVHVTGTTTITAITIPSGAERTVVFDGALTLTHNGTTLILPSAANITTVAGDSMIVRGDGSGNARVVSYNRASGTAVVSGLVLLATLTPTAAANVDFLTTFTSLYDNYLIIGDNLNASADDTLAVRFAVAGSADTGANYAASGSPSTNFITTATSISLISLTTAGKGSSFICNVKNANDATNLKTMTSTAVGQNSATPGWLSYVVGGVYFAANAITGIRLFWLSASNFKAAGKVRIYGYSNT